MKAFQTKLISTRRFEFLGKKSPHVNRRRPRVGLALSGGGVKAVAHIGVLSVLAREGLGFDMVAGTSAGALVGLFHCAGHDPESMSRVLQSELAGRWWWRWLPFGKYWRLARLLRNGGLQSIMQRHVQARRFDELPVPFYVTSTDLVGGEAVIHDRGDVVTAVQASMSLPGLAQPVADGARLLVDGGLLTYLPTTVLKERGADVVIGIDLSNDHDWHPKVDCDAGAISVMCRSWNLQNRTLYDEQLASADLIIRPRLAGWGCADFAHMDAMYERGVEAGAAAVERIRALLRA